MGVSCKFVLDQAFDRRLLDNLSTAVLLLDAGLRVAYLNPAGEMLLGVSLRQAHGQPLTQLLPRASELQSELQQALAQGQIYTARGCHLQMAGERDATVDCTLTPFASQGEPTGLLIELTQVDVALRISREEQLFTQHSAVRALIRGLAHEVKNPLGGLRGAAQLLQRQLADEELKEYTRIIIHEADRLQGLMNRMLGANSVPQRRSTNIHEVVEHVRQLVSAEVDSVLTWERDYDPSIPPLYVDPDMLVQALLNIARNAVQALRGAGTIRLRTRTQRQLTIGPRRHRLAVRIDVQDDGPGVPPELLDQIFYPMVTGRPEGTGLGLAIAQSLVQLHGGLIECVSRPGDTTFTLLLPLENGDV